MSFHGRDLISGKFLLSRSDSCCSLLLRLVSCRLFCGICLCLQPSMALQSALLHNESQGLFKAHTDTPQNSQTSLSTIVPSSTASPPTPPANPTTSHPASYPATIQTATGVVPTDAKTAVLASPSAVLSAQSVPGALAKSTRRLVKVYENGC